jgi:hypothetical protein
VTPTSPVPATVIVLDFTRRKTYRITYADLARRMREQQARGIRMFRSGSAPPPKEKP